MDLQLRQKYKVNLVAIKRQQVEGKKANKEDIINVPMPSTEIMEGDMLMVAGSDIADQDKKNSAPTSTAGHAGIRMTNKYPNMANKLKTSSAFLNPRWSER